MRTLRFVLLFLLFAVNAQAGPGLHRIIYLLPPVAPSIALPDSFLISASVRAWAGTEPLERQDHYKIDLFHSTIHLSSTIPSDSTLKLAYDYLPLGIPRNIRRRVPPMPGAVVPTTQGVRTVVRGYPTDLSQEASLRVVGTKTVGVRFGSGKDPGLDQSLAVQINGTIAGDVQVSATLSDESSPIQPEGTTQELRDLDRVVINLKRKDDHVSIGDCAISIDGFRFLNLERKMQGIVGGISQSGFSGSFAAASTKGSFVSVEFLGSEGKQGPYQLETQISGDGGSGQLVILSGTEKIWLDGNRMIRGSDRDYTIDYSTATLTFTEKHLLTAESRISVDFEYTRENYRRTVYAATLGRNLSSDLILNTGIFREADDPSQPLEWSPTDDELDILELAGDDQSKAVKPSYRYVGPGGGTYDTLHVEFLVPDENGSWIAQFDSVGSNEGGYRRVGDHFEYYGPKTGDFIASAESLGIGSYRLVREVILVTGYDSEDDEELRSFFGVPLDSIPNEGGDFEASFYREQGGEYVREGATLWKFVGPKHGDYTITKNIAMPRSHDFAVVGLTTSTGSTIGLEFEAAASRRDNNMLSSMEDDNNGAAAILGRLSVSGEGGRLFSSWRAGAQLRAEGEGFEPPGRAKPVDWERGWSNVENSQGSEREGLVELTLRPASGGSVDFTLGELKQGGEISRRAQVAATVKAPWGCEVDGRYNLSKSGSSDNKKWWTQGSVDRDGGFLGPLFVWNAEENSWADGGKAYVDMGGGFRLGSQNARSLRFTLGRKTTRERIAEGPSWLRSTNGKWWRFLLSGALGHRAKAKAEIKHSSSEYTDEYRQLKSAEGASLPEDLRTTVASTRISLAPVRKGPSLEIGYKISGKEAERMVEELVAEEEWETNVGEYDSLGNWVGTEAGTFKKILVPSGGGMRVTAIEGTASLRLRPGSKSDPTWRRILTNETTARIQVTSTTSDLIDLYLLRPHVLSCDTTTVQQRVRFEERLEIRPGRGKVSFGLQWSLSSDRDNRRLSRRIKRRRERTSIRTRGPAPGATRFDLSLYQTKEDEDEIYDADGGELAIRSRSTAYGISSILTVPLWSKVEALAVSDLSSEEVNRIVSGSESPSALEAKLRTLRIGPGLKWSFFGKGKATVEGQLTSLSTSGDWRELAGFLRRTEEEGISRAFKVRGDYRLQQHLTLSLDFSLTRRPSNKTISEGKMELVAYF